MQVKFLRKEHIGSNVWEFFFTTKSPLQYMAGQYVDVTIIDVKDYRRELTRTFSLTSVPSDNFISFATFFPDDSSPYKKRLLAMKQGDAAKISESMGDMVLPRSSNQPLIFVAGGLGIASFIAPLRQCARIILSHDVTLLWALRNEVDRLNFPVLNEFRFAYRSEYVAPKRLGVAEILERAGSTGKVYVSGSQNFTESIVSELRAHGLPDTRLAFDYFTNYLG